MTELINLSKELSEILKQYGEEINEKKEKALDKASDYLVQAMENSSPVATGKFRNSWTRTAKYKNVRYIGNSDVNQKNIPLANLLEYSKKGHPFMRATFEKEKSNIISIIEEGLKNG